MSNWITKYPKELDSIIEQPDINIGDISNTSWIHVPKVNILELQQLVGSNQYETNSLKNLLTFDQYGAWNHFNLLMPQGAPPPICLYQFDGTINSLKDRSGNGLHLYSTAGTNFIDIGGLIGHFFDGSMCFHADYDIRFIQYGSLTIELLILVYHWSVATDHWISYTKGHDDYSGDFNYLYLYGCSSDGRIKYFAEHGKYGTNINGNAQTLIPEGKILYITLARDNTGNTTYYIDSTEIDKDTGLPNPDRGTSLLSKFTLANEFVTGGGSPYQNWRGVMFCIRMTGHTFTKEQVAEVYLALRDAKQTTISNQIDLYSEIWEDLGITIEIDSHYPSINDIACDGQTMLIGDPYYCDSNEKERGKVSIIEKIGSSWTLNTVLYHPTPADHQQFGWGVAVDGDLALIGAPGSTAEKGEVHALKRTGGTWSFIQTLTDPTGEGLVDNGFTHQGDYYGNACAISGNTCVIGATNRNREEGGIFIYDWNGSSWIFNTILTSTNPYFGGYIAIDSDTIFAGSGMNHLKCFASLGLKESRNWSNFPIEVFQRIEGTWTHIQQISVNTGSGIRTQQNRVALDVSNNRAIIGIPAQSPGGIIQILERTGGVWAVKEEVYPYSYIKKGHWFGNSVACSNNKYLVGAPLHWNPLRHMGAIYPLKEENNNIEYYQRFTSLSTTEDGYYGNHVFLYNDEGIVIDFDSATNKIRVHQGRFTS